MSSKQVVSFYAAIFLTSLSAIVFEISLTKIFSVTLWYHFAYFVVSLGLFGLGAGGLAAFFWRERLEPRFPGILKHLSVAQFASMVVCLLFVLGVPHAHSVSLTFMGRLAAVYAVCAVPFFFVGLILSLAFRHRAEESARIYFWDLIGAGTGCIVFVLAITLVSGPAVVLLAALLALAASVLFAERAGTKSLAMRVVSLVVLAIILVATNSTTDVFRVRHTKSYEERDDLLFEKWSPLARITVYPTIFWRPIPESPFGWGMSRKYKATRPIQQLWIDQDASAGTPITRFTGDLSEVEYVRYDITSFVYHVRPGIRNAFIIGSGGGRDVLTALSFGVPDIVACDINPVIVGLVKDTYGDFAGHIYDRPDVRLTVGEGRNRIRSSDETFDVIQIPLVDSWAATAAGAFALAENNLYTVEAFSDYLDRLDDDGILSVTRFLFRPRTQSLRAAIVARRALELRGVEHPGNNIAVISTPGGTGTATILVKKTPFSPDELRRIGAAAEALGFEVLRLPGQRGDADFDEALTAARLGTYIEKAYYDFRPTTDDRPFFFQMVYFSRALDVTRDTTLAGQTFNFAAPLVLLVLLGVSAALVVVFFVLPLAVSRKAEPLPRLWGAYFILLGAGFMFVEIPLLQRGALYLGHPTFSLTVVLFSMLTCAGVGSYWSGRTDEERLPTALGRWLIAAAVLVVVAAAGSQLLTWQTIGLPTAVKIVLFVILVGAASFVMGTAFPSGIRLLGGSSRNSIPWVWALNGGASVLGSVLAMAVAMAAGYTLTLLLGGVCYVGAFLLIRRLRAAS
jgi:hypothetical protein